MRVGLVNASEREKSVEMGCMDHHVSVAVLNRPAAETADPHVLWPVSRHLTWPDVSL